MTEVVERLKKKAVKLERKISKEKGEFTLFGLFLREEAPNTWDLVVSAPWIGRNKATSLKYLARQLCGSLTNRELLSISRIVTLDEGNPTLTAILKAVQVEQSLVEIKDSTFVEIDIKQAFVMTARKLKAKRSA